MNFYIVEYQNLLIHLTIWLFSTLSFHLLMMENGFSENFEIQKCECWTSVLNFVHVWLFLVKMQHIIVHFVYLQSFKNAEVPLDNLTSDDKPVEFCGLSYQNLWLVANSTHIDSPSIRSLITEYSNTVPKCAIVLLTGLFSPFVQRFLKYEFPWLHLHLTLQFCLTSTEKTVVSQWFLS